MKLQLDLKKIAKVSFKHLYFILVLTIFGYIMATLLLNGIAYMLLRWASSMAGLFLQVCGQDA